MINVELFHHLLLVLPELWIFSTHNLQVDSQAQEVLNLIDSGQTMGYNGNIL